MTRRSDRTRGTRRDNLGTDLRRRQMPMRKTNPVRGPEVPELYYRFNGVDAVGDVTTPWPLLTTAGNGSGVRMDVYPTALTASEVLVDTVGTTAVLLLPDGRVQLDYVDSGAAGAVQTSVATISVNQWNTIEFGVADIFGILSYLIVNDGGLETGGAALADQGAIESIGADVAASKGIFGYIRNIVMTNQGTVERSYPCIDVAPAFSDTVNPGTATDIVLLNYDADNWEQL